MAKTKRATGTWRLAPALLLAVVGAVALSFWLQCAKQPAPSPEATPDPELEEPAPVEAPEPEGRVSVEPDVRENVPIEEVAAPATAPAEREPRDLVARVVTADRELRDGVPVCFFVEGPDGRPVPNFRTSRLSGGGAERDELPPPAERDPALRGLAIWRAADDPLRRAWRNHDRGGNSPPLILGVSLPGGEATRVTLELSSWPTEPVELVIGPEILTMIAPLRVEVYLADGSPAPGVPVTLFGIPVDPNLGNIGEMGEAVTGADGVAFIERDQLLQFFAVFGQMGRDGMKMKDFMELFVAPTFPLPLAPRTPYSGELDGEKVVRIDLPPVGRLHAEVVDSSGEPLGSSGPGGSGISYRINWTAAAQPPRNRESTETLGGEATGATIDLGWVGLGMSFDARFWPLDGSCPGDGFEVKGPVSAGEVTTLRFQLRKPFVRLAFQVLDANGQPLTETELQYLVRESVIDPNPKREPQRYWRAISTDGEGRFRWIFPYTAKATPRVLELQHGAGERTSWGSVALPVSAPPPPEGLGPLELPTIEMGTIQLGETPLPELGKPPVESLLAEGAVTDLAGVPLGGATVWARVAGGNTNLGSVKTDERGHFELRTREPVAFRLSVTRDGYIARATDSLEPGSAGLVYELAPGATLRGQLINSPETLGGSFFVYVDCGGVTRKDRPGGEFPGEGGAGFEVDGMPPGRATVCVVGQEFDFEFARFEGIELRAGEVSSDPRLDPLDMEPLARAWWFRFERTDGERFDERYIWIEVEGTRDSIGLRGRERKQLVLPAAAERAVFTASGYRAVEVVLGGEEVLVRLEPGP